MIFTSIYCISSTTNVCAFYVFRIFPFAILCDLVFIFSFSRNIIKESFMKIYFYKKEKSFLFLFLSHTCMRENRIRESINREKTTSASFRSDLDSSMILRGYKFYLRYKKKKRKTGKKILRSLSYKIKMSKYKSKIDRSLPWEEHSCSFKIVLNKTFLFFLLFFCAKKLHHWLL